MDLSKLPKFSQTPPPANDAPSAPVEAGGATGDAPKDIPGTSRAGGQLFCRCGAPLPAGMRFCAHCGASYEEATGSGRDVMGGGLWIEAFLSIAVGVFMLLMMPNGVKYLSAKMSGQAFTPYVALPGEPAEKKNEFERFKYEPLYDMTTGQLLKPAKVVDIYYVDRFEHYWADMAITAFAFALMIEGIVLALIRNRWAILGAGLLVAGAAVLNIWYVGASYSKVNPLTNTTYGFPPFQLLAAIFGVVMAAYQFRIFQELSRVKAK